MFFLEHGYLQLQVAGEQFHGLNWLTRIGCLSGPEATRSPSLGVGGRKPSVWVSLPTGGKKVYQGIALASLRWACYLVRLVRIRSFSPLLKAVHRALCLFWTAVTCRPDSWDAPEQVSPGKNRWTQRICFRRPVMKCPFLGSPDLRLANHTAFQPRYKCTDRLAVEIEAPQR